MARKNLHMLDERDPFRLLARFGWTRLAGTGYAFGRDLIIGGG